MSVGDDYMVRNYIKRLERDGILKDKPRPKYVRASVDAGMEDHRKGIPRYMNSQIGGRGKSWAYGWNLEHGLCEGCPQCRSGNKVVRDGSERIKEKKKNEKDIKTEKS
jgi:hypothetical protein